MYRYQLDTWEPVSAFFFCVAGAMNCKACLCEASHWNSRLCQWQAAKLWQYSLVFKEIAGPADACFKSSDSWQIQHPCLWKISLKISAYKFPVKVSLRFWKKLWIHFIQNTLKLLRLLDQSGGSYYKKKVACWTDFSPYSVPCLHFKSILCAIMRIINILVKVNLLPSDLLPGSQNSGFMGWPRSSGPPKKICIKAHPCSCWQCAGDKPGLKGKCWDERDPPGLPKTAVLLGETGRGGN